MRLIFGFLSLLSVVTTLAQTPQFSRQDTLRGTITPERSWWDLTYYHLKVRVNPDDSTFKGSTVVNYRVLSPGKKLQIDLQDPLTITRVTQGGKNLKFTKDGFAWYITPDKKQTKGNVESIEVFYEGKPQLAKRPPWDGGVQWVRDQENNPWVATSCQGLGASVWWPCKDHMYDEPDSMLISITVPQNLMDVSNGRLRKVTTNSDQTKTFDWFVDNPINNYGVNINVGNYVTWSEKYPGEKGNLDVSYYALKQDEAKAREQFKQVPLMLKAFEHWFGPYPFYEDGYKLVHVPYLGMEHQSSVTYGNRFENGYLGRDLSGTGWGLKWDFIIIHESGHEWFANNITYKDMADMWVHESFTNYSESLFTEYYYGKDAASQYIIGTRKGIQNKARIMGFFNVNNSGSGDMYPKGGNMLHTIRQIVDNDEKWRQILRGLNSTFYHKTVEGKEIREYIAKESGKKLDKVFEQYLNDIRIPVLEYRVQNNQISYRWANCIDGFDMPVKVGQNEKSAQFIYPTTQWQPLAGGSAEDLSVDPNFYVTLKKLP